MIGNKEELNSKPSFRQMKRVDWNFNSNDNRAPRKKGNGNR